MDVGKRPSRLRRHLPMTMAASSSCEQASQQHDQVVSHSSFRNHPTASHALRRRKQQQRTRLVSDTVALETKRRSTSDMAKEVQRKMIFHWLIWIGCGGWIAFLVFRIVFSLWRGEYNQLSLVHYIRSLIQ